MICRAPRSCCHVHSDMQIPKRLLEAVRGMQMMIIPGFALPHARTAASYAPASVKSHFPSNQAIHRNGRVVPTLLRYRFSRCVLGWGVRFGFIATMFLSMARRTRRRTDFVGWASSAIQLRKPSVTQKDSVTRSINSVLFSCTIQGLQSCLSGR